MMTSIYGQYESYLQAILSDLEAGLTQFKNKYFEKNGQKLFEHLYTRIKANDSMVDKLQRKGLPITTHSALTEIKDAIGLRIICSFIDDIFILVDYLKQSPGVHIVDEKDFINNAKPNGYRSYHLILAIQTPYEDVNGNIPGTYYAEIQLRTIAMDTWASLEHQLKYKHNIANTQRIEKELKRCADELASCDLSLQTIRQLIIESSE